MYAVIRTGGKQYRVAPEDVIEIEKVAGGSGEIVSFSEVLMVGGDGDAQVGTPLVEGATVAAEVVDQRRAPKILVFKKKRRKNYRRKRGHRQELTAVRITEILTGGKKPAAGKAAAKKSPAKAEEAAKPADAEEAAKQPAETKEEAKKPVEKTPPAKTAGKADDMAASETAAKDDDAKKTTAKATKDD